MGSDPDIYYCEDHDTLIVVKDGSDRVLLNGLNQATMLKFARKLVQKDLDETLAKYDNIKDVAQVKEPADVESWGSGEVAERLKAAAC